MAPRVPSNKAKMNRPTLETEGGAVFVLRQGDLPLRFVLLVSRGIQLGSSSGQEMTWFRHDF